MVMLKQRWEAQMDQSEIRKSTGRANSGSKNASKTFCGSFHALMFTNVTTPVIRLICIQEEVKAKHTRVTYAYLYQITIWIYLQRSTDLDVLATKEALLYTVLIQYVPTAKVVLMEAL
nr:probable cyclic nucleotide-gated ion channel 5 [Tanacetum cinerariifolium]